MSAQCTNDTQAPAINCPANITVSNNGGQCGAIVGFAPATATDNCGIVAISQTSGLPSNAFFPLGTTTNTYVATDLSGNTSTCSFDVTVLDTEVPNIVCAGSSSSGNLLANPGFETGGIGYGMPNWGVFGNVFTENVVRRSGLNHAKIFGSFSGGFNVGGFFQGVPAAPGETYTASAYMMTPVFDRMQGGNEALVKIEFVDASNNVLGFAESARISAASTPDLYTYYSATGTAPANTVAINMFVLHLQPAFAGGSVFIDDASLERITVPEINVNNDPGACGAVVNYGVAPTDNCPGFIVAQNSGFPNAVLHPVGVTTNTFTITDQAGNSSSCSIKVTVTDNEAPVLNCGTSDPNILINPSFDNGAAFNQLFQTNWNRFGAVFAIDANLIPPGQDGSFYLKMFGGNSGLFQDHPVNGGDDLDASVYIQNASFDPMLPGCEGFIKLEYFDAGNNLISVTESNRINNTLPQNTWTQITLNDIAPANATTVRFVVIMQCSAGGAVFFDDASLINNNAAPGGAPDLSVECISDVPVADPSALAPTDNCPGVTVAHEGDTDNGGSGCAGDPLVITRTYSATDQSGNQATCDQVITVEASPIVVSTSECHTVFNGYSPAACTDISATATGGCPPYTVSWSNNSSSGTQTVCPTATTTYTVTFTDAQGCTGSGTVTVNVIDVTCGNNPNNPKVSVCKVPPGNPGNAHNICVSPNAVAAHLATGSYLGACGGVDPCTGVAFKSAPSGETAPESIEFTAFPNPFSSSTTIQFAFPNNEEVEVLVLDLTGKQIARLYKGEVMADVPQNLEFAPENGAQGIYFVKMITGSGKVLTQKLHCIR